MLLEGRRVVVIGGSSGIGLAIGRQARAEGASLVITGRDPGKLSHAASVLGGDTQSFVGDAHDHAVLESFIAALPGFDHLVSMIGDTMAGGFLQTPIDTMRHVLHSKFWTNLLIARFAAPLVRDGGSMTFTSGSGVRAQEAAASYVANEALAAMAQGIQFHGSNVCSSWALVRPETMRSSTSVSQAIGSTPFSFAVYAERDIARPDSGWSQWCSIRHSSSTLQSDSGKQHEAAT